VFSFTHVFFIKIYVFFYLLNNQNRLSHIIFGTDVAKPWHHSYQDVLNLEGESVIWEAIFEITF